MATIANFGGEIKQFEMDVDKSSSVVLDTSLKYAEVKIPSK